MRSSGAGAAVGWGEKSFGSLLRARESGVVQAPGERGRRHERCGPPLGGGGLPTPTARRPGSRSRPTSGAGGDGIQRFRFGGGALMLAAVEG